MTRKAIRETLGFMAVVASLAFVGLETRQNTAALESAALQSLAELRIQIDVAAWTDETMPGVIARLRSGDTPDDFSADENQRIRLWFFSYIRLVEAAYRQAGMGVVDESTTMTLKSGLFNLVYLREAWPSMRYNFAPAFADFFESEFVGI